MKGHLFTRCISAAALVGGLAGVGYGALPASATGQTAHGITLTLNFDTNLSDPNTLQPQPQPPFSDFTFPAGCPIDASAVFTITGNAVQHSEGNKNGEWAGETVTGTASISDTDAAGPTWVGHFTGWVGFGTNQSATDTTGQAETGETVDFHGTSAGAPNLDIHIDAHATENNSGTGTTLTENFSCS